jgi:ATP-dependent Clp protease ATP-binding subunit ClpC
VVLFDEIEKAHPDLGNLLLQVLEDGRLTGSDGQVADFSHTVILLTSNVGSQRLMAEGPSIGFGGSRASEKHSRLKEALDNEVKRHFRPELLDRLDDVLVFQGLEPRELRAILDIHIEELAVRLADRDVALTISGAARDLLIELAELSTRTGARPLRRAVQRHVQDGVSEVLVAHGGQPPARIRVGASKGKLTFQPRRPR